MIFKNRRFLSGGMLNVLCKDDVKKEAEWFDVKCIRIVDSVMMLLPYIQDNGEIGNDLIRYIFKTCKVQTLPVPHESWRNSSIGILRVYYHIMTSHTYHPNNPYDYLSKYIKIDGDFVIVSDGQGDNR